MSRRTAGVTVAVTALVLAGCAQPRTEPDLSSVHDQDVAFESCDGYAVTSADATAFAADPTFECARVTVPLDYDDPDGRTVQIALLKAPARGERIGSLLLNPGGPGGPGMSMAAAGATTLADSRVTEHFDLIGFDPRGVGASTPAIDCFTDAENDAGEAYTTVLTGSRTLTEDDSRRLVERCAERSGGDDVLSAVGTRDAARDMDILREVLGDEKLSYLGQSYGTRLGAVYAEMFPQNVRAMVLDGAIDPAQSTADRRVDQFTGFQRSFDEMAASCAASPDCPLGPDPSRAVERFQDIVRPLVENPIVTESGRRLDFDAAYGAVVAGLYDSTVWPVIIRGIAEVTAGQGDTLLKILDVFGGRDEDGTHPNFSEALYAVNCMDEDRNTPEEEVELKRRIQEIAPFTDAGLGPEGARDPCEFWPAEPTLGIPYAQDVEGVPDTLTISITGDPSTPYEGGVNLADTLGGTLLPVDGEQHTVAISGANACVNDIVADYLVELATPEAGTRCTL
ncbi:alpha/beta fold hydrolase [Rhodococcus sp. SORGH_AS_0303]|uniref:alpha/beta fold hydrolase n=1 Tax=Rhodococcus sp. SORGH_AS_0303 TaxID=3041753 RepID=UPI002787996E|nr:alpha/beta fold hydrolase [Rhodococcus sp. SORGH_AS_0303]MDQ1203535.1 pimeloyl-ACP methyl ester carboxylesterase [Rhodococcus sp. SORGH_AS_0303]